MNESKTQKVSEFLRAYFLDFILFLVCAVYVLYGILQLKESGKTLWQIVLDASVAFLFGFVISRMMSVKGVINGKNNPLFKATVVAHGEVIEKVTPYFELLEPYCDKRSEQELAKQQADILRRESLRYSDFIAGAYDGDFPGGTKEKKAAVKKARQLKIKQLSARELLCEEESEKRETFDLGPTLHQYMTRTSFSDIAGRVITVAVFGYFGVSMMKDFNYATLIWSAVQVAAFLALGGLKYLMSYIFVTDGLRNRIIRKINHLHEFYNETNKEEKQNG